MPLPTEFHLPRLAAFNMRDGGIRGRRSSLPMNCQCDWLTATLTIDGVQILRRKLDYAAILRSDLASKTPTSRYMR